MPSKNNFPLSKTALESKMAAFIKDRSAQNLAAILQLLPAAGLFLTMAASTPQARQALKNGDTLSPQMRKDLHPIILKTQKGEDFLPLYDKLLRDTSSGDVRQVAAGVGIDVTDVNFWRGSLKVLTDRIDEFERI